MAMLVGLVSGLLAAVPGPAHAASSRFGTVSARNWVDPGACAPPMSWAYPFQVLPAALSWLNSVGTSVG